MGSFYAKSRRYMYTTILTLYEPIEVTVSIADSEYWRTGRYIVIAKTQITIVANFRIVFEHVW